MKIIAYILGFLCVFLIPLYILFGLWVEALVTFLVMIYVGHQLDLDTNNKKTLDK